MNKTTVPRSGLQLRSHVKPNGTLELYLVDVPIPAPTAHEVVVQIEATPLNPSDLGLLFGAADLRTAVASGTPEHPIITANIPEGARSAMAARVDQSLPVGNEGAGIVVQAGSSEAAQNLLGKRVAVLGGAMYSQYRCLDVAQCLALPADASSADGASSFVNPLTALGMVETMKREEHKALVHTAAASNLGQMLNRICLKDNIGLVNVVRKPEQAAVLRAIGAPYVCDSSSPSFMPELAEAIAATGATIAFDAIGGGKLAGQILTAMENALSRNAKNHSIYGTTTHKQVYIYGSLDMGPTELVRNFGMTWGMGGWLLTPFLQKIGPAATEKLKARVVAELKTTFASSYSNEISLVQVLHLDSMAAYAMKATGAKFLIRPNA